MADIFQLPKLVPLPSGLLQEQLVGAVNATGGVADAGKVVILDSSGQLSPSMVPGAGSVAFSGILSGTNNSAAMVVTFPASLSGNISASASDTALALATNTVTPVATDSSAPTHAGQLLISQPGNASAIWADPQVQGLYPAGSVLSPAPAYAAPTDIQPVLIGGSDGTHLRNISTDSSGNVNVNVVSGGGSSNVTIVNPLGSHVSASSVSVVIASDQSAVPVSGTFWQATQPISGTVAVSSVSGSVAVTGTFFQATQPISGTVAVSSVSGSVAVTGTFWQTTQPVSIAGTVTVDASGTTVPVNVQNSSIAVTGTFWQATQPVSGTVAVTQSTSPWVVEDVAAEASLTAIQTSLTNLSYTSYGSPATENLNVYVVNPLSVTFSETSIGVTQLTSPWVVSGTVAVSSVSGSVAVTGTFWQTTQPVSIASTVGVTQSTSPWVVSNGGTFAVQVTGQSFTVSGSPAVSALNVNVNAGGVFSRALNQDGSGNVGVNVENTVAVTGTFSGSTVTSVTPGTYVSNAGGSFSSVTTASQTLTGVVGGDTLIVGFSYTSTSTISSVTDNFGNVYDQITTETTAVNGLKFALYYATGVFAGSTTVSVVFNTSTSGELAMVEYNGTVYLQTSTSSNGSASSFSTSTQGAANRPNNMEVMFVYGQGGTLVPNNTSITSSPARSVTPRFTTSNYLIGECILNESYAPNFAFTQGSSSGYAWLYAEFAIMNPSQVPLMNTTYFTTPTAFVPIGGIDTAGNSVRAGVVSVQGVSSGGLWISTDVFKQAMISLTSTASGIGGSTGFSMPVSGQYQLAQPLLTTSNSNGIVQLDIRGNQLTSVGVQTTVGTAWSSGTAINTFQYLPGNTTEGQLLGAPAVYIQLDQTTPFSAGAVTFQGTYDNVNWVTIPVAQVLNPNTFTQLTNPYTFVASTNQPFLILMQGYQNIRLNLTSTITGAGTVTPYWAVQSILPEMPQPLPSVTANSPSAQTVTSTSGSVLASNTSRKELRVTNTGTVAVYLGLGQTPTATAYHVALSPCTSGNDGTGGGYTSDLWKGAVNAIVASTSGTVVVTELT
jgi:hypothetical protein